MKKIRRVMSVLVLGVIVALNVEAASKISDAKTISSFVQSDKEKIKKEDLPSSVTKKLETDYAGWAFVQAYKSKSKNNPSAEEYEVELKKDNQSKVVVLDKDGNVIR